MMAMTYILRKCWTVGESGAEPETISRMRPPKRALTLLNTTESQYGVSSPASRFEGTKRFHQLVPIEDGRLNSPFNTASDLAWKAYSNSFRRGQEDSLIPFV